jgi:GTPase SAR1 family protein
MIEYIKENTPADENMQYIVYSTYDLDSKEEKVGFSVIFNKSNIFARMENNVTESYVLYGNEDKEALGKFIETIRQFYVAPEEEKNNLFLVAQDMSGFKLNKWHIKEVKDFDFNLQYNDDFPVANATIKDFIEEDGKSGLLILWGEKGTGKTTYIRHLISSYPNKKFVFIPSNLITMLGDPSFGNFLLSLQNSIIILEDCEAVIRSRKSNSSASAVSLLLNMGDGLMSDDLGIKFICTFNEEVTNIDEALMRKGRLACMYEFKKLTADKVGILLPEVVKNKIAEYEKKIEEAGDDTDKVNRINEKITKLQSIFNYSKFKDMTLADIYNVEDASFIKETKKIGF